MRGIRRRTPGKLMAALVCVLALLAAWYAAGWYALTRVIKYPLPALRREVRPAERLRIFHFQMPDLLDALGLGVEALVGAQREAAEAAKDEDILIVSGRSFGCPSYLRVAYCVSYDTIIRALPGFGRLYQRFYK